MGQSQGLRAFSALPRNIFVLLAATENHEFCLFVCLFLQKNSLAIKALIRSPVHNGLKDAGAIKKIIWPFTFP